MSDEIIQTEFEKLPRWIQQKIKEITVSNPEDWITRNIPALENQSVIETLKTPTGEEKLRAYFSKVIGRF